MALLSDNDLDEPEIAELIEMRVHEKLGISPEQFRSTLHGLCDEILRDDDRRAGISVMDPSQAVEMMSLIDRDAPMSFDAVSHTAMVQDVADRFYTGVTRYTTSAFLRVKLRDALVRRGLAARVYESAEEARSHSQSLQP
jgi:hypothetical protein